MNFTTARPSFLSEDSLHDFSKFDAAYEKYVQPLLDKGFTFEWTREPKKIWAYKQLCNRIFSEMVGEENFPTKLEPYEVNGDMLVVSYEGEVVGGFKMNKTSQLYPKLSFEHDNFSLDSHLREISADRFDCVECSRLVIAESLRGTNVLYGLLYYIALNCIEQNAKYMFAVAPALNSRIYKIVFKTMLDLNYIKVSDVELPNKTDYGDYRMQLFKLAF